MLFTIDIGNTQTVYGIFNKKNLIHHFRLSTNAERTGDETAVLIREILMDANIDLNSIKSAIISSVVPPVTPLIVSMCKKRFNNRVQIVGPGIKTGMPIHYQSPQDVGADRIVNAIAGYELFKKHPKGPQGLVVVDFGTATTFDLISPQGAYLGGAIAPGVLISRDALVDRASKLPKIELDIPNKVIGTTTVTSMQSGIFWGYTALVQGMVHKIKHEIDFEPQVIATGGLASFFIKHCPSIMSVHPYLTLEGLRLVHERNA